MGVIGFFDFLHFYRKFSVIRPILFNFLFFFNQQMIFWKKNIWIFKSIWSGEDEWHNIYIRFY